MLKRKWSILAVVGLMTIVLTQYQNCAMNTPTNSSTQNVKIVEELAQQKVAFLSTKFEVYDSAKSVLLNGLCAKAQQISWSVQQDDKMIEGGVSDCVSGSFQIELKALAKYPCSRILKLQSAASKDTNQNLEVVRLCSPTMAEQVSISQDGADICYKELRNSEWTSSVTGQQATTCETVCYHNQIVAIRRAADCSDFKP